jgi:hypothetical protein
VGDNSHNSATGAAAIASGNGSSNTANGFTAQAYGEERLKRLEKAFATTF